MGSEDCGMCFPRGAINSRRCLVVRVVAATTIGRSDWCHSIYRTMLDLFLRQTPWSNTRSLQLAHARSNQGFE